MTVPKFAQPFSWFLAILSLMALIKVNSLSSFSPDHCVLTEFVEFMVGLILI